MVQYSNERVKYLCWKSWENSGICGINIAMYMIHGQNMYNDMNI